MIRLILILSFFDWIATGIVYVNRHTQEYNEKINRWSFNYTQDQTVTAAASFTVDNFVNITKALLYINFKVAEDDNDREYRREVIKTVIDLGKFVRGLQGHPILRFYIEDLKKTMDFNLTFPIPPVSPQILQIPLNKVFFKGCYKVVNWTLNSLILPFDVKGYIDYRLVGKTSDNPTKMRFFMHSRFYGGYKQG